MSAGGGREEGAAAMLQLLREQPEPQAEESGAERFALCLPPGEEEVKEVEETIEEMLIRLDEFCGMTDVAFVKMVGRHVSFLEEQVLQAEGNHNTVSHAVRKLLQSAAIPSFKNHFHDGAEKRIRMSSLIRSTLPQHSIHMTCLNSTELKIIFLRTTSLLKTHFYKDAHKKDFCPTDKHIEKSNEFESNEGDEFQFP
ncbi:breast carcinoma-amplified sequence 4 isoform X3 [Lepidochelys kempii]|uniref:breast carcinoma-amplified sequence 4 isoform X3 n=1 Tax=Lepidochelys kempii TaxID=8472 RepID=UPI003C704189